MQVYAINRLTVKGKYAPIQQFWLCNNTATTKKRHNPRVVKNLGTRTSMNKRCNAGKNVLAMYELTFRDDLALLADILSTTLFILSSQSVHTVRSIY
jgi:hypothetical protein